MVRSDGDEDYVNRVAGHVDRRIQEVMERTKTASTLTAALLACLNIADELLRSQEGQVTTSKKTAVKIRDMIRLIDAHLEGGGQSVAAG